MLSDRAFAGSRWEVSDDIKQRPGHGVQSTRLNLTMNTDAPLFAPYEEFDYDDSLAGSDKNSHFSG